MTEQAVSGSTIIGPAMIDAFVKANQSAMKGFERVSQYFLESAQQNFLYGIETNKRLSAVKSLAELKELQTELAQEFITQCAERNKAAAALGTSIMHDATASAGANGGTLAGVGRKATTAKAA